MERDIEFLYEMGALRHISRTWNHFHNHGFANVAEHTIRVMWLSLIIAKRENADVNTVIKLALIHNIPESRTGDVNYLSRMYNKRDEDKAIREMLKDTTVEDMKDLFEEWKAQQTMEAKIVKDADYLDVDFEIQEDNARGGNTKQIWKELRENVSSKLFTDTAKRMWNALQNSNPHSYHLNANNRFTTGDWKN